MSDYEHIVISAVRYALGRMTYIVSLTVNYVLKDIEEKKLSNECLRIICRDILEAKDLGMDCDRAYWQKLFKQISEVIK